MMGLFSRIDSTLNRPLEPLPAQLRLASDTAAPLLGEHKTFTGSLFALACAYEAAEWEGVNSAAAPLGIGPSSVCALTRNHSTGPIT